MGVVPTRLRWIGSAVWTALATGALVAVALRVPEDLVAASVAYVTFVAALAARMLVKALVLSTSAEGSRHYDLALSRRAAAVAEAPQEPRRIARELGSSLHLPSTLQHRLRPRLRAIAADRLAAEHGLGLDDDPEGSSRLLGGEAWEFLRPDREPIRRAGRAISPAELERIVSAVEGLSPP